MKVEIDQLESLWPQYRGAILLRVAQQSRSRVSNSRIAVVAGHVALSLEVHSANSNDNRKTCEAPAVATDALPPPPPSPPPVQTPRLHLTVLLDVIPDDAERPTVQQMARFLSRVLEPSEEMGDGAGTGEVGGGTLQHVDEGGLGDIRGQRGETPLGEDVPELLVVENNERVVASEFLHLDETNADSGVRAQSSRLVYACIEADGLLRLWKWRAEGLGWRWIFLNKCNICACRENPRGSTVLNAVIGAEPEFPLRGDSRHRIFWEQEDLGEGAGLGLAVDPTGPRAQRKVWSRRITFESALHDGDGADQDVEESGSSGANDGALGLSTGGVRLEIALGFSVSILPMGVDELLCSGLGAWMVAGDRIFFNHFATGRLRERTLPRQVIDDCGGVRVTGRVDANGSGDTRRSGSGSGAFTDSEGDEEEGSLSGGNNDEGLVSGGVGVYGDESVAGEDAAKNALSKRLFAVHDATGDLMMYDPPGAIRTVSLPNSSGGLTLRLQCTLNPPPSFHPQSFVARLNQAVFVGGGVCSIFDLCTGQLLGRTYLSRYRECAFRQHRHSSTTSGSRRSCGRQVFEATSGLERTLRYPVLWASGTRGHLVGIVSETQVLRVRLPRTGDCVKAMLMPTRGQSSPAPHVLRCIQEYRRLLAADDAWVASLLPELFRLRFSNPNPGDDDEGALEHMGREGSEMIHMLYYAFSVETGRGKQGRNNPCGLIPPWLLLAMMSAAQKDHARTLTPPNAAGGWIGDDDGPAGAARDPVTSVAESRLRKAVEDRVAESLRSLDRVRTLLRDPAGSARQGARVGVAADDGAVDELDAVAAEVDPATALFEGTLRRWLACRRGGEDGSERMQHNGGVYTGGYVAGGGDGSRHPGLPGATGGASEDIESHGEGIALAFWCETAGDAQAQEIPFLRFLLNESHADSEPSRSQDAKFDERLSKSPSSASTFLCLHLTSDDASPLFEVACRALFRLRPLYLPRFVERLARFRTYADKLKEDITLAAAAAAAGGDEGGASHTRNDDASLVGELGVPSVTASELEAVEVVENSSSLRRDRSSRVSESSVTSRRDMSPAASVDGGPYRSSSLRSLSPAPGRPRAHTGDGGFNHDDPSAAADNNPFERPSRHGKRRGEPSSRERSPTPTVVSAASGNPLFADDAAVAEATDSTAPPAPSGHENPTEAVAASKSTSQAYFARALACLPPTAHDRGNEEKRRARLSLLMGARMFTEACRLLRARAWEGVSGSGGRKGSWRQDRGAIGAWAAAMRLLGELKREAVEEEQAESRRRGSSLMGPAAATVTASPSGGAGSVTPVHGSVGLQYRLMFEDALAETILKDTPDRMRAVMNFRPAGLAPVAVVRIIRRALAAGGLAKSHDVCATASGEGIVRGDGTGMATSRLVGGGAQPDAGQLAGSTARTLKECLSLLVDQRSTVEGV